MPTRNDTQPPYCQYSESQIMESGLLTPERMTAVTAAIDARIKPCCLPDGTPVKNAFVADHGVEGLFIYAAGDSPNQIEYMRRRCLPSVLTAEELGRINGQCSQARTIAREQERFAEARKVESWDGGVWLDDHFFPSMEELSEHLTNEGSEWPSYVWAAAPRTVIHAMAVADVVENQLCDRGWEDMDTHDLHGVAELQAALDKFVQENASVLSYEVDYSVAVLTAAWKQPATLEQ